MRTHSPEPLSLRTRGCLLVLAALVHLVGGSAVAAESPAPLLPQHALGQANVAFAMDLYAKLAERPGNVVLSPMSVSTCLAMAYDGARGRTQSDMAKALHMELDRDALRTAYAGFLDQLKRLRSEGVVLDVGNALWVDHHLQVHPEFTAALSQYYGASTRSADFHGDADLVRAEINAWVESQTHGRIKGMLGPGWPRDLVVTVLANAVYFHGDWDRPFTARLTRARPFFAFGGEELQVQTMRREAHFRYCATATAEVLELPYKGRNASMLIVLPRIGESVRHFRLTDSDLATWDKSLEERDVYVELPRFSFQWGSDLSGVLASLGMADAFTPAADFSGIVDAEMWLSQVMHGAMILIDETGTEAAAATVASTTLGVDWNQPLEFKVNRPFLFLIREHLTGSILFAGKVERPEFTPEGSGGLWGQ